eukprot:CAMPEP_0202694844 /NCGR_PEP_ID=MMETSP1385-20130828/8592_1 /ASSEMBLY_ACC=CAM_ASM_000861 /TAXON_ID=933848 /ORGANISM="Elphidium margaritaceum" /LENGTH=360 /DNA_ID=CAMNT_0049350757 /DNA_START=27 /DNA_END=1109 /DNA_ORIENTATION=+
MAEEASFEIVADDSWKDLVADKPIVYTDSELQSLRASNKLKWRKYLHMLWASDHWKETWNFEGSEDFHCAVFEPHHKKEVLDLIYYQFSSCGNNTFHKILNTAVGSLKYDCMDCMDHLCLTGLAYVLLDRYNHVCGVFYGWDIRDEPVWTRSHQHHMASIKEDEITAAANAQHSFANNLFERNRDRIQYGSVFFGEVLCVRPNLMSNGWFTKLSFNIAVLFGMDYDIYYDYDFQPDRHLYRPEVFRNIEFIKTAFVRYDLFYFGDFQFECDGSNMADNYARLAQEYQFTDVDNLRKNAFVGCFILRNSKELRQYFNHDFIQCNKAVQQIRKTQEQLLLNMKRNRQKKRQKKKKNKLKSKL